MLMGVAAIHDYGFDTISPLANGPLGIIDAAARGLIVFFPVWAFFIARKKNR
jgi:hypothetical protein